MRVERKRVKKSIVAKYWLKRWVKENRETITEDSPEYPFFQKLALQDWGEPSCWACNWWNRDNPEAVDCTPEEASHPKKFWNAWDRSSLQACHIVPHSLGGTVDPSNILLLCSDCHAECCDIPDAKYMKIWVGAKEMTGGALWSKDTMKHLKEMKKYIKMFNVTDTMLEAICSDKHKSKFAEWYHDNAVFVAFKSKPSTEVAMIHRYCEQNNIA